MKIQKMPMLSARLVILSAFTINIVAPFSDAHATSVAALPEEKVRARAEWALRYSDLVVRGKVRFVMNSTIPVEAVYPSLPKGHMLAYHVSLDVEEFLKGASSADIRIVVPDMVISPICKPGDTVIVSANYNSALGAFVVNNTDGYFVQSKNGWQNRSAFSKDHLIYETTELRALIQSADLQVLAESAEIVVVGEISSLSERTNSTATEFRKITTAIVDVRKTLTGAATASTITVVCVENFTSPRSAPIPKLRKGETWYFLLRRADEGMQPLDGPNSLFKYDNGRLLYNGRAPYRRTPEAFERVITEGR